MRIVTYSGKIHSAECTAIALLNAYYESKNVDVYLSRIKTFNSDLQSNQQAESTTQRTETGIGNKFGEPEDLINVYIGIGNIYNHEMKKYDYHQNSFNETWIPKSKNEILSKYKSDKSVTLSSAGLIWKHYGSEIIELYLSSHSDKYSYDHTDEIIQDLLDIIYLKNIIYIDAHANGIVLQSTHTTIDIHNIVDGLNFYKSSIYSDNINGVNNTNNINNELNTINNETTNSNSNCANSRQLELNNYINKEKEDMEIENENFNRGVRLVGEILEIHFLDVIGNYFNYQNDLKLVEKLVNEQSHQSFLFVKNNIPTLFKCLDYLDPNYNFKFCVLYNSSVNEYTIKTRRLNGEKYNPVCPISPLSSSEYNSNILYIHKNGLVARTKTYESALTLISHSLISYQCIQLPQLSQSDSNPPHSNSPHSNSHKNTLDKNLKLKITQNPVLTGVAVVSALSLGYLFVKKD